MAKPEDAAPDPRAEVGPSQPAGKLDSAKPVGGLLYLEKDIGQEIVELEADRATLSHKLQTLSVRIARLQAARMAAGVTKEDE